MRVVLVDDDRIVRAGLRAALGSEAGFAVVGDAATIPEALAMALRLVPRVVLAEAQVGDTSVVALVRALREAGSAARVLVLAGDAAKLSVSEVMKAGASGVVLKEDGYSELLEGLKVVAAGRRFFSDTIETQVLQDYVERLASRHAGESAPITPREREVLARIGQGQSNKVIAKGLGLSVKTVEKHRSNLMRKLGLHNTAAVTVYALRQGLVSQDGGPSGRTTG